MFSVPFSDIEKEEFDNYDRLFSESVEIANIDTISKSEPCQEEEEIEEQQLIFSETIAIQTNKVTEPQAPEIRSELESKVCLFKYA